MPSFAVTTRISGLEPMLQKIQLLKKPEKTQERMARAGGKVLAELARTNLTASRGKRGVLGNDLLSRSIGVLIRKYRKRVVAFFGPRWGFREQVGTVKRGPRAGEPIFEDPGRVGSLVEHGHFGPHPAPPYPFMRPAVDTGGPAAFSAMAAVGEKDLGVLLQ